MLFFFVSQSHEPCKYLMSSLVNQSSTVGWLIAFISSVSILSVETDMCLFSGWVDGAQCEAGIQQSASSVRRRARQRQKCQLQPLKGKPLVPLVPAWAKLLDPSPCRLLRRLCRSAPTSAASLQRSCATTHSRTRASASHKSTRRTTSRWSLRGRRAPSTTGSQI